MKSDKQHENGALAQTWGSYRSFAGSDKRHSGMHNHDLVLHTVTVPLTAGTGDGLLAQNLAKAPPGRSRDPGGARGHPPESRTGLPAVGTGKPQKDFEVPIRKSLKKEGFPINRTILQNEKEELTKNKNNKNSNYYKHVNFITMKKQILFLVVFVLAAFASVNVSYGQPYAVHRDDPQPISCTNDALHPTAGVPYIYTLDATPAGGTWMWYATKNTTFVNGAAIPADSLTVSAGDLVGASANYGKDGATNQVSITWSEAILDGTTYQGDGVAPNGTPTFVVGYYKAASPDCSDNIKIYELDPKPSFTVDILNLNPTTNLPDASLYTYSPAQCVDVVQSATYTATHTILYDFGTNYLYYEFVAANFTDYWVPTFALTGLDGSQTLTYEYTYEDPSNWATTPPTWTALVSGTTQLKVDPTVTNTATGVSVYVRVTVKNNDFETLAYQTAVFSLDGQNKVNDWDVVNSTCVDPKVADHNDQATQTITERPTVKEGTTSPINPDMQLIPKN